MPDHSYKNTLVFENGLELDITFRGNWPLGVTMMEHLLESFRDNVEFALEDNND